MFSIQSYKSVRRLSPLDLMVSVTTTQLCYCRSDLACSLLISGLNHPSRYSVASDIPSVFSFFSPKKVALYTCVTDALLNLAFTINLGIYLASFGGSPVTCIPCPFIFLAYSFISVENYCWKILEKWCIADITNYFLTHSLSRIHYIVTCFCLLKATLSNGLTRI